MADDTAQHDDFDLPDEAPETEFGTPATEPSPGAGTGPGAETVTATPGAEPITPDPNAFSPELTDALRRERLAPVPGETSTAAYARLTFHLGRKSQEYGRKIAQRETEHAAALSEIRAGLAPIVREHYQRQRRESVEAAAAQIPPKDTPEYQVWLNEEVLRRIDERDKLDREKAEGDKQTGAERAVSERLAKIDESGYGKVELGLGLVPGTQPDMDFVHAYEVYSESAIDSARDYFPDANDAQIQEFIGLSQQLDIRRAEANGVDIRDVMKGRFNRMIDSMVRRGIVARVAGAAAKVPVPGEPAKALTLVPVQTVAQRVTADSAAAARRAPLATPATTRPSQLAGQLPDPDSFDDEDDYVSAAIDGILGSEEQRVGKHRMVR